MSDGHLWETDASGQREYHEPIDGHGGPRCVRCGYWYCEHCHDTPPDPACEPDGEVLGADGMSDEARAYWVLIEPKCAVKDPDSEGELWVRGAQVDAAGTVLGYNLVPVPLGWIDQDAPPQTMEGAPNFTVSLEEFTRRFGVTLNLEPST